MQPKLLVILSALLKLNRILPAMTEGAACLTCVV
jgi:hypothetical protein